MKRLLIVLLSVGLILAGCSGPDIKKKDPSGLADPDLDSSSTKTETPSTTSSTGGGSTGGSVQPLTGGAGAAGVTPVAGGENLGDAGGGPANAIKGKAKGVKTKVTGDDHSQDDSSSSNGY